MKTILISAALLSLNFVWAQKTTDKKEQKVLNKYQSSQAQDFSVPPPPITTFPSQFPTGNKDFLKKVESNLNREELKSEDQNLNTQIILKIDAEGNVLNISLYGTNQNFNDLVRQAVVKTTENIKWEPAKNKEGKKVIDIVRLPFRIKVVEL